MKIYQALLDLAILSSPKTAMAMGETGTKTVAGQVCPVGSGRRLTRRLTSDTIISNGLIKLGITAQGALNVPGGIPSLGETFVGLRYIFPDGSEGESTSHGCTCEGWGAGADGTSLFFNTYSGSTPTSEYSLVAFSSTATTALSTVSSSDGKFQVTHDFHPSPDTDNLYEVTVSLENTSGGTIHDLRYRRNMDWDIHPTPFSECVTIQPDPSLVDSLVVATNNGFTTSDPYIALGSIGGVAPFTDLGPTDHGAAFDFQFGPVDAGQVVSFQLYYGAGGNQAEAEAALASISAEVYSLGKPNSSGSCVDTPNVFIFGFKDVGGGAIFNSPPAANCQDVSASANDSCQANASIDAASSDPNGDAITLAQDPAGPYPLGDTVVTLTVSDGLEIDTCTAIVTVENNPPTVTSFGFADVYVDGTIDAPASNGQLSVTANDPEGQALSYEWTTTCLGATITNPGTSSASIGTPAGVGDHTCSVTVTVCDSCASCTTESRTVNIIDPPTAVCGDTADFADGSCQADVSIDAGSYDPASESLTLTQVPGGPYEIGSTPVQLSVSDGVSTSTCDATVTVLNDPPTVTSFGFADVYVDGTIDAPASNGQLSVTANDPEGQALSYEWTTTCLGATITNPGTSSASIGTPAGVGDHTCSVTVTVCDSCASCTTESRTVNIIDPPTAVCGDTADFADGSCQADVSIDAGSYDPASESLTLTQVPGGPYEIGSTPVQLSVSDGVSTSTCDATVTVLNDPPTVTSFGFADVYVDGTIDAPASNGQLSVTANDPEGQALSYEWTTTCLGATITNPGTSSASIGTPAGVGDHTCSVTVTVCDSCASCTTESRTVNIIDPPTAVCGDTADFADGSCQADVSIDAGSYDPASESLTLTQVPGGPYEIGSTPVQLSVSDGVSTSTCDATVTVLNDPPTVTSFGFADVYVDGTIDAPASNGQLSVTANDPEGQALSYEWTTTCLGATITNPGTSSASIGTPAGVGDHTCSVTVTVCDSCASCTTETGTVTIIDPPNAECHTSVTVSSDPTCKAQVGSMAVDNGSWDPADEVLTSYELHDSGGNLLASSTFNPDGSPLVESFTPFPIGDTSVSLLVTDGVSFDSCTSSVTVTNTPPSVNPLDALVVFVDGASGAPAANGQLSVTASDPESQPLLYDWTTNCPNAVISHSHFPSATMSIAAGTEPVLCYVTVEICDDCGEDEECTTSSTMVVIADPANGFVTGGGWIDSPKFAYISDTTLTGRASFGFVSKYKKGRSIPEGQTQFQFKLADLNFHSTSYEWLVVTGADCAKYKGLGTINGLAGYGFMLTACDNRVDADPDTFRIKIWAAADDTDVVYDNKPGAGDDSYDGTNIGGGYIRVHQKGKKNLRA